MTKLQISLEQLSEKEGTLWNFFPSTDVNN